MTPQSDAPIALEEAEAEAVEEERRALSSRVRYLERHVIDLAKEHAAELARQTDRGIREMEAVAASSGHDPTRPLACSSLGSDRVRPRRCRNDCALTLTHGSVESELDWMG